MIQFSSIEEIENRLGSRNEYIMQFDDIPLLRKWAIAKGFQPFDVERMRAVELTNLYHKGEGPQTEESGHRDINDLILKVLEATNAPGFEVSLTRRIARAEMQQEILSGDATRQLIKETLEALAPRRIEIVQPSGITQLDGLHHHKTETVIKVASLNIPIMMVGPAGCGKTTIGEHTAKALNLPFYITPAINETHQLEGFVDGYGNYHPTPFRYAFQHGGVWVADEIDAWDANALLAANAALANGYTTFPDNPQPVARHPQFRMIATANTYGNGANRVYVGRNELDAASLDRFAMIEIDYDENLEKAFSNGNQQWLNHVLNIRHAVNEKRIRHVVSSRAIANGAKALSIGLSWNAVNEMFLLKGLSENDREKIL